eukprot:2462296-Prymnesium_polylepis.2
MGVPGPRRNSADESSSMFSRKPSEKELLQKLLTPQDVSAAARAAAAGRRTVCEPAVSSRSRGSLPLVAPRNVKARGTIIKMPLSAAAWAALGRGELALARQHALVL